MESLVLRPMLLEDVKQMNGWRFHEDPWFYHYNFDCQNKSDHKIWLKSKRVLWTRDIFALFLDTRLIGFITIKNYNWLSRTAEMGISMDLNYVNKGYGAQGLKLYLDYVFSHTFFKRITLRVVSFNKRAIKAYEKAGFRKKKKTYIPYEEQRYASDIMKEYPSADYIEGEVYAFYYFMAVEKGNVRKKYEF